jgi:hypothetical protein
MIHSSLTMTFHDDPRVVELRGTMPVHAMRGVGVAAAKWCKVAEKRLVMRPWPETHCILGTSEELDRWAQERAP